MTRTAHKYAWSLCAAVWSVLWVMYHLAGPLAEDYVLPSLHETANPRIER